MGGYMISNLYVAASLATLAGAMQGIDVTSMSSIIGTPQYMAFFNNPGSVEQGGITASMAGGSLIGAFFSTFISDRKGRRDTLFLACIFFLVGSTLMSAVQNVAMLIVARVINGFAVGMLSSQAPLYIAEISPPNRRGRLISIQNWMITWGILLMYLVSYGCSFLPGNESFRVPWALQMIPALILMSAVPFMPRSPRWLATKGRWEEAIEVLAALHTRGDHNDPLLVAEVREIRESIERDQKYGNASWSELFKRRNVVRVHTALFTHLWGQYCGLNALMYYIVYIFQMAGLSSNASLTASIVQYVIVMAMNIPSILFNDRFRRRWVLMSGSLGMATFLFTTGALLKVYGHPVPGGVNGVAAVSWAVDPSHTGAIKAIIACSYLFVACSSLSWGPVAWIYPPEVSPLYIRSKTVSLSTVINWAGNFSLTFFTPPGFENLQYRLYFIFGTFNLAALVHVFLLYQETVGKTLEEMDFIFDNESIWAFKVKVEKSRLKKGIEDAREMIAETDENEDVARLAVTDGKGMDTTVA